ncbi:MAG: DMT family transporter [Trueperaceae bacterium]|nr:MAG: DMT family transporter [Trueperaceae bacterium]
MTTGFAVLLLLLAILWGSAFPMIKIGLSGFSVLHLTLARHLVASLLLGGFLMVAGMRLRPDAKDIPFFFLLGLLGFTIYHLALNFGELSLSAGGTSLIIATAPAITAVIAFFELDERLALLGWIGIAVSFVGVALIVLGDGEGLTLNPYALFVLLSALVTSLYFVLQRRVLGRYRPVEMTAFATWAGTVPMLLFVPGFVEGIQRAGTGPLLATVYIGAFPSAIAYSMLAVAISRAPINLIASFLYTVPIFSLLFSWLFLGEIPSWLTLVGGTVAILGIVIVNRSRRGVRKGSRIPVGASRAARRSGHR